MYDHPISRRHLLAVSGAGSAALALSACGAAATGDPEETEPEREAEVLGEVLAAQLAVVEAGRLAIGNAPEGLDSAIESLSDARKASAEDLGAAVTKLGGSPSDAPADNVAAESPVEALAGQLDAAIATSLDAIAEITTDAYRQLVHRGVTEDAAYRALIADTLGEEPAAEAFVGAGKETAS